MMALYGEAGGPTRPLDVERARVDQINDLGHRFTHHAPTPEKGVRHSLVRQALLDAAFQIAQVTQPSREQSLAFTALEEAMFWANAAIAREV